MTDTRSTHQKLPFVEPEISSAIDAVASASENSLFAIAGTGGANADGGFGATPDPGPPTLDGI